MSDLDKYCSNTPMPETLTDELFRAIAQLRACRPIPEAQVRELCHKARELLIEEGNVVTVTAPVTVRFHGEAGELIADRAFCRYAAIFMGNSMT